MRKIPVLWHPSSVALLAYQGTEKIKLTMNTNIKQQYLSLNLLNHPTNEIMNPLQRWWDHWIDEKKFEGWIYKVRTWAARVWRKVHVALPSSSFVVGPDFPCWRIQSTQKVRNLSSPISIPTQRGCTITENSIQTGDFFWWR